MTNQQAINILSCLPLQAPSDSELVDIQEAVKMAIKALEEGPHGKNDLISREALKITIEHFQIINPKLSIYDVLKLIDNAQAVEPIQGKWITHKTGLLLWDECNQCGAQVGTIGMNYCPGCGARMDGGEGDDN